MKVFKNLLGENAKIHTDNLIGGTKYSPKEIGFIESGSNLNGDWVKLPDGTLICSCIIENVPYEDNRTQVFPYVFKSEPFVVATPIRPGGYRNITVMIQEVRSNQVTLSAGNQSVSGIRAQVIAIGKWK